MAIVPTSQFTTGGNISNKWFDQAKRGVIREKVTGTGYQPSLTLTKQVPANARILMAAFKVSSSTVGFLIGSSAAQTTAGQVGVALIIGTAPTALTTSLTTANWATLTAQSAAGATLAQNANAIRSWDGTAAATNGLILPTSRAGVEQSTAARSIYLVPFAATTAAEAAQRFQVGTSTAATVATTGYVFNTSATASCSFDVEVFYEEFTDTPSY